jgi:t-SNARE complex subunit (syntaxin)
MFQRIKVKQQLNKNGFIIIIIIIVVVVVVVDDVQIRGNQSGASRHEFNKL